MPSGDVWFLLPAHALGGAELTMLQIARGLHARGYPVALAIYGPRRDLIAGKAGSVPVIDLGAVRTLAAFPALIRRLRRDRPGMMVAALAHANLMAIAAAKLAGGDVRVVVTEHNPVRPDTLARMGWKHRPIRWLMRLLYPSADAVVAVSAGIAGDVLPHVADPARLHVIHNPVLPRAVANVQPAHPWLEVSGVPLVLGVGRLSPEKGFDALLRGFARVRSDPLPRLAILGEGRERAALLALVGELGIGERVLLPGFVDETGDWMARASVFVSASRFEGFGNAIVEALAAGLPVVATDCPTGPAEILAQGRHGRLVPVDDAPALAEAIVQALADPRGAGEGPARAAMFGEPRCLDAYAALIASLLGHPPMAPA